MIRILLVDDHVVMRQLLRSILESYPDLLVVGEAGSGEHAVARANELLPSVVIIDVNLPTMNGFRATELIKLCCPATTVIGLTAGRDQPTEQAMITAGAAAVVSKEEAVDALYPAIIGALKVTGSLVSRTSD
jgi:DNA-binding NarL/FixJ family response regulator